MAGRPKTGNKFVVRQIGFTPEQDEWLDQESDKTGLSRSEIVRNAMLQFIQMLNEKVSVTKNSQQREEVTL